ncbi:hypothetical protein NKR23_g1986 [Pleurostoma richardsiae]|uniref:Nitrogen regulatory protein areA GATA-like domain-containing protein n=1 Tax=Pleurostoma richardsiae TaxID=41990 RepID=A0AA38S8T4_9PEZI|nr:hypothetical protein NKR23_g1986 [Pleurostoma richardsiae]
MAMPMILPRGIVVNTDHIYDEVAGYTNVPLDKIYEFWHVYTTTQRQLFDPTAQRLENFWWHVWGSDRRHLSGRKLAKLYENISTGPSFAPLRGPLNRYEGPLVPRFSQHESDKPHPAQRPKPELVQHGSYYRIGDPVCDELSVASQDGQEVNTDEEVSCINDCIETPTSLATPT